MDSGPLVGSRDATGTRVNRLDEVGDRDSWRCWLCDEPVDPARSVNDARGPSVDSVTAGGRGGKDVRERLAHRACNTRKGAVKSVVPWPDRLFVIEPAPIVGIVERLRRKGGREVIARSPSLADAEEAGAWLVDRLSRLAPELAVRVSAEPGGGQYMVVLAAG